MSIIVEYFDNFDSAAILAKDNLDRSAQPSLFNRLDWMRDSHGFCFPTAPLHILCAHRGNAQAWLFLTQADDGITALAPWYSFRFAPLFYGISDDTEKQDFLTAIARNIRHGRIAMRPVPVANGSADLIIAAFKSAGWAAYRSTATVNWIANVADQNFDDYWAKRSGAMRSTVKRKAKKNIVTTEIIAEFTPDGWAAYEAIYAQSWKPEEGSPDFLRLMAIRESKAGTLRLGLARIGNRPVAAQLWTVENGTALIHKLAYVEDAAEFSPGTLLSVAMFRHVLDQDKVAIIDYGTGNDGYKSEWMDIAQPLELIELYNLKTLSGLYAIVRAISVKISHKIRSCF